GHFSPSFRNGWPGSREAGFGGSPFPLGKRLLVNTLSLASEGNPGSKENHDKEKINAKDQGMSSAFFRRPPQQEPNRQGAQFVALDRPRVLPPEPMLRAFRYGTLGASGDRTEKEVL